MRYLNKRKRNTLLCVWWWCVSVGGREWQTGAEHEKRRRQAAGEAAGGKRESGCSDFTAMSFLALPSGWTFLCYSLWGYGFRLRAKPRASCLFLKESIVNTDVARLGLFAELIVVWWCHSHWPEEELTPVVWVFLKCHLHNYGWRVPGPLCVGFVLSETVTLTARHVNTHTREGVCAAAV